MVSEISRNMIRYMLVSRQPAQEPQTAPSPYKFHAPMVRDEDPDLGNGYGDREPEAVENFYEIQRFSELKKSEYERVFAGVLSTQEKSAINYLFTELLKLEGGAGSFYALDKKRHDTFDELCIKKAELLASAASKIRAKGFDIDNYSPGRTFYRGM